jgi:hypothetical protein
VTDLDVYLVNFRGTNQPLIFFGTFFGRFSVRGVQKHHKNILQKVHVENFFRENSQKIDKFFDQFFLSFFCYIAFLGVSWRWEFKSTTKNVLQKNRVETFFKKIQNRLFLDLFLSRFWAFLGEESSKTRQKDLEKKTDQPW